MDIFVKKAPHIYTHTHISYVCFRAKSRSVRRSFGTSLSLLLSSLCCACVSQHRLSSSSSKVIGVGVSFPILIRERDFTRGSFFSRNARENTKNFASVSSTKLALLIPLFLLLFSMCDDSHSLSLSSYSIIYSNHTDSKSWRSEEERVEHRHL